LNYLREELEWNKTQHFDLLALSVLGVAVLIHVILVNITLGTGWISAMARFLACRRKSPDLEIMSRRVFKILIIHELFSGVWGTIITIVLAGFFPTLTAVATDIIFYPILIALSSILIRIPSIALFWYTWGKIKPSIHAVLGFVMAISGFGVPLGFRPIFAQLNYPNAFELAADGFRSAARVAVFFDPVYLPLLLHTWFGALSIGGFIVASFFTIKRNVNAKFAWIGLWHGILFLGVQGLIGPWYLLTLRNYTPILFSNILGLASATFNIQLIFFAKILMLGLLLLTSLSLWRRLQRGKGVLPRYALALGPMALLVAIFGEFMNDAGRYPYLVLTSKGGILPSEFLNEYVAVPLVAVGIVLGILLLFVAIFMGTAYYALNRRFLADLPS
jgi:cytochrome d ubiquinol oxidase subunit I